MPNFKSGNFKQKNKPFKDSKKSKKIFKEDNLNNNQLSQKAKSNANDVPKISKKIQKEMKKECLTKIKQKFSKKNRNKVQKQNNLKSKEGAKIANKIDEMAEIIAHSKVNRRFIE